MYAISATNLVKRYHSITAVDDLTLDIHQGELFSLLGVNGAGKTTTIKMLSCLVKPTAGDALVGGYRITKSPQQVKALIGRFGNICIYFRWQLRFYLRNNFRIIFAAS